MSNDYLPKISFQESLYDKMLPFTFDLPPERLHFIDRKTLFRKFELMETQFKQCKMLGIDTETRPCFAKKKEKRVFHPTSIIQIAVRTSSNEEAVFIIDLLSIAQDMVVMEKVDELLLQCFLDPECVKIGQGLDHDIRELYLLFVCCLFVVLSLLVAACFSLHFARCSLLVARFSFLGLLPQK
jgi:hypothetical protein